MTFEISLRYWHHFGTTHLTSTELHDLGFLVALCPWMPLTPPSSHQTWFPETGAPRPAFPLVCYVFTGWFCWCCCCVGGLPSATSYRHYPRRQPPFTSCVVHVPMWTRCVPSSALAATPPTCVSVEHAGVIYPMMLLRGRVSSQPRESGKHGDGEGCNPCVATIGFAPRERVVHYSSADSSLSVLWPLPWVHSIAAKDKLISYQLCRFIPGYRWGKSLSKQ